MIVPSSAAARRDAACPPDVVVVVPARDEDAEIADCITALRAAALPATATGAAGSVRIVVVAHRCTDQTARTAERTMGSGGVVLVDAESDTVGAVRALGVAAATAAVLDPAMTWVFNTDADSRVPHDWITAALQFAQSRAVQVVAGVTELRDTDLTEIVLDRYQAIVRSHRRGDDDHDHVYGANLAIRLDAYRAVGGFADRDSDEDVDLVQRCREGGHAVGTPTAPAVLTSARTIGRAPRGVAHLLADVQKEAV